MTIKDALVSSYSSSGSHGAAPSESICLNFTAAKHEYSPQPKSGSLDGSIIGGYNVKENRRI